MANGQLLVPGEEAANFAALANTKSGQKSIFGDPSDFSEHVYNAVNATHAAVSNAFELVGQLVDDPTRNNVMKHEAARQVYNRAGQAIETGRLMLERSADQLQADALETTNEHFFPDPKFAGRQEATRQFIERTAPTEGGLAKVRQLVKENSEVATVVFHNHSFLLGMSEELRQSMIDDAIDAHLPKVYGMIEQSQKMRRLAGSYAQANRSLKATLFNSGLADRASLRVNVD